jgi:alpha-ketoglutarate-dependent taurine dioxygenase
LDTGVRHENVNAAEGLDRLLYAFVDLVLFRDIHANADRSLLVAEFLRRFGRAVGLQIGDRHTTASLNVTLGDAVAESARGAGNESNLAVELYGSTPYGLR